MYNFYIAKSYVVKQLIDSNQDSNYLCKYIEIEQLIFILVEKEDKLGLTS